MEKLLSCEPHYFRFIKPNDEKRPSFFEKKRVRHQIRYLGLVENVRVRRAGFAFRMTYDRFMRFFIFYYYYYYFFFLFFIIIFYVLLYLFVLFCFFLFCFVLLFLYVHDSTVH